MNKKNKKTKTKSKTKVNTKKEKSEIKLSKPFIITILIILIITIASYFLFGIEAAIILFIGISIILLIARILDSTSKKKKQRKILKTFLIIFLVLGIVGVIGVGAFLVYVVSTAPEFDTSLLKEKQSTILYDSDGNEFAKLGSQIRENIEYDDLPEIFIDALIATEDSRFFQHNGLDLARFSKAAVQQLLGNDDAGGGSTISMQVIKNSFTDTTSTGIKGLIRKFTDIYLAVFKLEKNYTKEQIIEFYVNNHNLGGAWGVEEASKYYFGKSAKDMNLAEAALLAGMYQAPGTYNPYKNPDKAEERRSTVLNLMVRHGYITREEADLANSIPVTSLLTYSSNNQSEYQGYIDTLVDEIEEKYGLNPLQTSMLIYTNMDREKQDALNDVANGKSYTWINDYVQTGIVAVDSETGKVEALIAARNYNGEKLYNFTTDINRQIGSTAKPLFDYAPGIEYNNWSTYTLFDDSPYTYSDGTPIRNYDSSYKGLITLRYALSDSRNIPALKAFQQVDKKKIIELVTSVGITPEISGNTIHEAHAIGSFNGSNPMEMAGAYQIFSNGGNYTEPYLVSRIVLRTTGEVIENEKKIASTTRIKIQGKEENYLSLPTMSFWDFLKDQKRYIDENGVVDVEKLTGGKLSKGNGTDGVTDVYKIEINEENNEYTLKYYGEASEEPKLLLTLKDKNTKDESSEIVEPENPDDWEYTVSDGVATLTKYLGDDEILIVPNYIDGIPVKQVGNGSGQVCDVDNTDCVQDREINTMTSGRFQIKITEIKISNGVEKIGQYCFQNIDNLKNIEIPSSINNIESFAFDFVVVGKTREMTLKIPKTVINVGRYIVGADDTIEVEFKNEEEVPDTWEEEWNRAILPRYGGNGIHNNIYNNHNKFNIS